MEDKEKKETDTTCPIDSPADGITGELASSGGLGDSVLMPDVVEIVSESPSAEEIETIENAQQSCQQTSAEIQASVTSYLSDCRRQCDSVSGDCLGCYLSLLGDIQRRIVKTSDRCTQNGLRLASDRVSAALESMQFAQSSGPQLNTKPIEQHVLGEIEACDKGQIAIADGYGGNYCFDQQQTQQPQQPQNPPVIVGQTGQTYPQYIPQGAEQNPQDNSIRNCPGEAYRPCTGGPIDITGANANSLAHEIALTLCDGQPHEFRLNDLDKWVCTPVEPGNKCTAYNCTIVREPITPTSSCQQPQQQQCCETSLPDDWGKCDSKKGNCDVKFESTSFCNISKTVSLYHEQNTTLTPTTVANQTVVSDDIFGSMWNGIKSAVSVTLDPQKRIALVVDFIRSICGEAVTKSLNDYTCTSGHFVAAATTGAALNFAGNWLGTIPDSVVTTNRYTQNLSCQYLLPSVAELNKINIQGFISNDEWEASVAANGVCIPWAEKVRDSSYTYPNVGETISAYRREAISDSQYDSYLKKAGIKDKETQKLFEEITKYVVGPSDLIRFMVRDVFDQDVVNRYGYSQDFDKKFTGQAKKFAKAVGISEDVLLKYWQAHWDIPSPTQFYEMLHRLRDDGVLADGVTPYKKVTVGEVVEALKINDMAPAWVERLVAISYRPLGRIDIRRAYELDVITGDSLKGFFQDLGYSPENSEIQADYVKADSADRRASKLGVLGSKEIVKYYTNDWLSRNDAEQALALLGFRPVIISRMLDTADFRRRVIFHERVYKAARKKFMTGEYDRGQLIAKLVQIGIDQNAVSSIVENWTLELELKVKQPTVAVLCKWANRGYISSAEFLRRVKNLGYSEQDAANFVNNCNATFAEKTARQLQAEIEKSVRKSKQQKKEARQAYLDSLPCKPAPKPVCGVNGQSG